MLVNDTDHAPTWHVFEAGGTLYYSTAARGFDVMRVEDAEAAIERLVEKAAAAVAKWRERAVEAGFVVPESCGGTCEVPMAGDESLGVIAAADFEEARRDPKVIALLAEADDKYGAA